MNEPVKVTSDGTPSGTKVTCGNAELGNITSVNFEVDAGGEGTLLLFSQMNDVQVQALQKNTQIVVQDFKYDTDEWRAKHVMLHAESVSRFERTTAWTMDGYTVVLKKD